MNKTHEVLNLHWKFSLHYGEHFSLILLFGLFKILTVFKIAGK